MKKFSILLTAVAFLTQNAIGQFEVNYNPDQQPTNQIQYFKPVEKDLFVGDCMPFRTMESFICTGSSIKDIILP